MAVVRDGHGHTWQVHIRGGTELLLRQVHGQQALYGVYARNAREWDLVVLTHSRVADRHTFMSRSACFRAAYQTDASWAARGANAGTSTRTGTTSTAWTYTTT